jgi:hypothetical protein
MTTALLSQHYDLSLNQAAPDEQAGPSTSAVRGGASLENEPAFPVAAGPFRAAKAVSRYISHPADVSLAPRS